jgi:hypothetical protein
MSGLGAVGFGPPRQPPMLGPNAFDHLAISNVLSRYVEALDTKNFELLEKVFANDVVADYPFNSNLEGVDGVSKAIQNRYVYILVTSCQHTWTSDNIQPWTYSDASQPHNAVDRLSVGW